MDEFCNNCRLPIRFFERADEWMHGPDLKGSYWNWCDLPTLDATTNLGAAKRYPPRRHLIATPEPEMPQVIL